MVGQPANCAGLGTCAVAMQSSDMHGVLVCWCLHLLWRYREVRRCEQQPQGPTPNGTSGVSCRVRDQLVEQELIYEKLPKDIAHRHVLLMDPILATGNSAAKAIQAS